ncbi:MAG: AGE family epimerase/isomerase, partial [Gemmatimonadetes bacterium]|nr:AGE family epimerase/isomerase [Gemmatimonadota bacterium]
EDVVGQGGGALVRHYDVSGRPLDSVRSWGHDVEALHLVDDARTVLGLNGTSALERVARLAYARGLDNRFGGMEVGRTRWRRDRRKIGWVQAEALTCAARLSARSAGPPEWAPPPQRIWRFIRDRVLDPVHGGWREYLSRQGKPVHPMDKAHPWKACYHELRALLEAEKGQ